MSEEAAMAGASRQPPKIEQFQPLCDRVANRCLRQARWLSLPVAIALFLGSFRFESFLVTPVVFVAGYAVFASSALLVFDAFLFRLMASYPDDAAGGAAVDEILARMGLKPRPTKTRPLEDRIRGTNRILMIQLAAFIIFVPAWLAAAGRMG
jgi:hypothetical protein